MAEHKCPNCGHIFSNGICCSRCGTVFLFEDEYENKSDAEKSSEKRVEQEKYDLANEIIASNPQNDFEAKRREIIEDLLRQKEARAIEKQKQQQELKARMEKEAEEAKKRAEEEAKRRAEEEERQCLKELEEQREAERLERERIELEERYEQITRAEQEKLLEMENSLENEFSNEETEENSVIEETPNREDAVVEETLEEETLESCEDECVENKEIEDASSQNEIIQESEIKVETEDVKNEDDEITKVYKREDLISNVSDDETNEEVVEDEQTCETLEDEETVYSNEYDIENDEEIIEEIVYSKEVVKENDNETIAYENTEKSGIDKFLSVLRYVMIGLYSATILFMILPFSEIMDIAAGSRLSITNLYLALPIVCGLIIAIFEKTFIRKYIVGISLSIIYMFLYAFLTRPIMPLNFKDFLYFSLFALTFALSLTGIILDRSSMREKMSVWFDFLVYIILILNVFVFVFMIAVWVLTPGFVSGLVKINFYSLFALIVLTIVSCVLMLRHKNIGADLFLLGGIGLILLIIFSYDQMMNFVGYGIGNDYMHLIGTFCAFLMIVSVIIPIAVFAWLRLLNFKKNREV